MTPLPNLPISAVDAGGSDAERLVLEVLRSGQLAQGPMVERLEAMFADAVGVEHAMAVSSGTAALVLAIEAVGVRPGDEVITSAFTFAATLNAILAAGATARFADVSLDDFGVDVASVEASLSDRCVAILPVHLYGQCVDMVGITRLAGGRHVIEDAAQALGAAVDGAAAGSFGVGCFSLYATKNVTTGEGGVVTTSDAAVADRVRVLRNQGMRARYDYVVPGHNFRLTDLQAAVGVPQMARLAEITERRRRNAGLLTEGLRGVEGLALPAVMDGRDHAWHQYTVRVLPGARRSRDELADGLAACGVGSGVYYPRPVFDYPCYADDPRVAVADVPNARRAAREVLSLPVHPELSTADVERIVEGVTGLLS